MTLQRQRDWTIAMRAVSAVAGFATGLFSSQHFNRVAIYGVFANLSADFLGADDFALCGAADAYASPKGWRVV